MKNLFNTVKMTKPTKNVFDLTHDVKLSLNMGDLVPICCIETVPGDKFDISAESLLRFSPLVSPVMHRMDVTMHYFFVPNRLVNKDWEAFITNKETDGVTKGAPTYAVAAANYTPLMDYFGIPAPIGANTETINPTALAAYQLIYHEYYRDQNLVEEFVEDIKLSAGNMTGLTQLGVLRKRAWEHDYFTSALPFAQKGDQVEIPIGDVNIEMSDDYETRGALWRMANGEKHSVGWHPVRINGLDPASEVAGVIGDDDVNGIVDMYYDPNGTLKGTGESTSINDLRRAFKLQEWLEKTARGGQRYVENILAHFGVKSSDARLQRPEYITGMKSPVVISEIVNTTGTVDAPQGNMSGHAIAVTNGRNGYYFCEEHGYIIGIMSVMPKTAYQQGIPKHFLKTSDPFQYYWPSFAHIGEQEVLKKELYAFQGTTGNETFGYVPRYAEYKYESNRVAGEFRTTLDFWHLGRIFAAPPVLNQTFIECNPDTRIFAVTDPDEQKLYCHVVNKIKAVRPMPKFGTPTF